MTDDIRDDAPSDEDPTEDAPAAAEDDESESAPTAEEQDWEKRYRDREKTISRQGKELALLRAEVSRPGGATPPTPPDAPDDLPPAIAQELAFYRSQYQTIAQQQVVAQHGPELAGALDYFERVARLDPTPVGRANALMAAIEMLAEDAPEAPAAPAPKPKAPTRMESNRSDAAPPADLDKLAREAETKRDQKSLQAFLSEKLRAAGVR